MSLLDYTGPYPRDVISIQLLLRKDSALHRWLLDEARKRGISTERYTRLVLEEKRKEQAGGQDHQPR